MALVVACLAGRHGVAAEESLDQQLCVAAAEGDTGLAAKLIAAGAGINAPVGMGKKNTPLMCAAANGRLEMVKWLVAHGADVTLLNQFGDNVMIQAALRADSIEILKYLAGLGVSVNTVPSNGYTALHFAATNGGPDEVRFLLQQGAKMEVRSTNGSGYTPFLLGVAKAPRVEVATIFLDFGADVNSERAADGWTPLTIAVVGRDTDLVRLLLQRGADPNKNDPAFIHPNVFNLGHSPLAILHAAWYGELGMIRLLHEHGADLTVQYADENLLSIAADHGSPETLAYLIANGVGDGEAALRSALQAGNAAAVNFLIAKGYDPGPPDEMLINAACGGNRDLIQLALDAGANIESRDRHGMTPLHCAAWDGHPEAVRYLLEKGADLEALDDAGNSILMSAIQCHSLELVQYLVAAGADPHHRNPMGYTALSLAVASQQSDVAAYLLALGFEQESYHYSETDLLIAAGGGSVDQCRLLLDYGAPINARDRQGQTALMLAVKNGHLETVKLLIDEGADVSISDNRGETALQYVARIELNEHNADAITALLEEALERQIGREMGVGKPEGVQ